MKILVYPYAENPYQKLLYNALKKEGVIFNYFDNYFLRRHLSILLFILLFRLLYFRVKGYNVFHLHWTTFDIPVSSLFLRKILSTMYAFIFLFLIKLFGFKIVWTVHNVLPHENIYINEKLLIRFISNIVDAKIVHSSETIEQLNHLNFNTENISIIPLGNYIDCYDNFISREDARKILNITNPNKLVVLYLGTIRKYKGLENLIQAYKTINNKNINLMIAGKCLDESLEKDLKIFHQQYKNSVNLFLYHIKDKDIQTYFNAADIVVSPFNKVTTSSSVILSLSFKKPIIAPRIGSIRDLPKNIGIYYSNDDKDGLENSLNEAYKKRKQLVAMGENGYEYARSLSWDEIAKKTYLIFKKLD